MKYGAGFELFGEHFLKRFCICTEGLGVSLFVRKNLGVLLYLE